MSRRKQIWAAVFLAVATLTVLFAVGRSRRPAAPRLAPRMAPPAVQPQLAAPPRAEPLPVATVTEEPLPAWLRVGVVAAAMLAFFVVSLVARRNS